MNIYCIDCGNATVKRLWGGRIYALPACSRRLSPRELSATRGAMDSPVVSWDDGSSYLVGKLAHERLGEWNFSTAQKLERVAIFLAATLPSGDVEIDELLIAAPDELLEGQDAIASALVGEHAYTRNGRRNRVRIERVRIVGETYATFLAAQQRSVLEAPDRRNGIITVGGGTLNLAVVDSAGNQIPEHCAILPLGLRSLATKIAAEVQNRTSVSLPIASILLALGERQRVAANVDFSDCWDYCHQDWVSQVRAAIIDRWASQAGEIAEVLVSGAPAPLLESYVATTKGRFKIVPDPAYFALYGMQHA